MAKEQTQNFVKGDKMATKSIYDNIFKKKCAVCGHTYMADIYEQGECKNCGWYNGVIYNENPDKVIFSNMVSLNKAKSLYNNQKSLRPSLDDFVQAFEFYGEVGFDYHGIDFGLFRGDEGNIEFSCKNFTEYFADKADFCKNAKIGGELVRDIWDKIENPSYL